MGAINVNLFGVLHCSRAVINGMCERGFGRVITISSGAGITGLRIGVSPYAAGKGGAIAFMRHLAMENARFGVTANSLALGLMQPENSGPVDALAKQIPVGRTGTPEDVGVALRVPGVRRGVVDHRPDHPPRRRRHLRLTSPVQRR